MGGISGRFLMFASAVLLAGGWLQTVQTMRLGEVLVLSTFGSGPQPDARAYDLALERLAPLWRRDGAPAPVYAFHADRGGRKGQHALVWSLGTAARKPGPSTDAARTSSALDEYHLLSPATAGQPPDVDVLGIHYLDVQPERRDAFEQFVRDRLHPAVAQLRPDLRLLYYKGVSGSAAGSYITVFALTRASRDRYWPGGNDSDDLRAAFAPLQPLAAELRAYLVEGSYLADPKFAAAIFESREWADFVLIPRPASR